MKQPITILILLFLASCQTSQTNSTQQYFEKTDTVAFTRYWSDGKKDGVQGYLVDRIQFEDSILAFRYHRDTATFKSFEFDITAHQFKLISSNIGQGLSGVDTFYLTLNNEKLEIFKFEKVNSPPDGAFGVLVNEKYGMIGFSAYDWGSKNILTRWNDKDFEQSLRTQLIDSDNRLLSRQNPIPPPTFEEQRKLDTLLPDTIELELKEKK
jgi:hypothetical protein